MPTALPPATDYTGASVTQGGKKTFMTAVRTFLADLLGTTGAKSAAIAALGIESSSAIRNLALSAAVASNALTMSVKTRAGTDPSSTDVVTASMRATSAGGGGFTERQVIAALTLTIPSGATLGHASGIPGWLSWYLIDNAGTLELAVSASDFGASGIVSTTNLTAGSNSPITMYSTQIRNNVAFRRIARTRDAQTTAGTWAALPTLMELEPFSTIALGAARGEAMLTCPSSSQLLLSPHKGNVITFPDGDVLVPPNGVTLAPAGTSAGTLYYIYAVRSGIYVGSLEPSTTAPAIDAQTGIKVKTGDPSRVLVGMARPVTGPGWADSGEKRFVRSWFNDPGLVGTGQTGTGSTTSSSLIEIASSMRAEFLAWANESVTMTCCGQFYNNTTGAVAAANYGLDSTTVGFGIEALYHAQNTSLYQTNFALCATTTLAEGYHYVTPLYRALGGGTTTIGAAQVSVSGKGA